ncbi:MAG: hypothetical protein LBG61_05165, partial [Burkholderiales bacterium]|nr:hypothetical protein [Burkholderiales bacterium]
MGRSRFRSRWFDSDEPQFTHLQIFQSRLRLAAFFMLFGALMIFVRAFYLQYVSYDKYLTQAENNRIKVVPVMPTRGTISDRNGIILAHNYSSYTLEITPNKIVNLEKTLERLGEVLEITPLDIRRFKRLLEDSKNYCSLSDNCSLPLRARLTDEEVAKFAARQYRFPGVDIHARLYRQYPYKTGGSHAIGYIGRINDKDAERIKAS